MLLRLALVACLLSAGGPTFAAGDTVPAPAKIAAAPMVFYLVKGAADACGRGCDSWIEAEGRIDVRTATRFKTFFDGVRDRNLPIYLASPGGNVAQAILMGTLLHTRPSIARVCCPAMMTSGALLR